jgi:hypothetical protein
MIIRNLLSVGRRKTLQERPSVPWSKSMMEIRKKNPKTLVNFMSMTSVRDCLMMKGPRHDAAPIFYLEPPTRDHGTMVFIAASMSKSLITAAFVLWLGKTC